MRTNRLLLLIATTLVLCAACKKPLRTCADPAPGDTPYTVLETMALGGSLEDALRCSALDTGRYYCTGEWYGGPLLVNSYGTYAGRASLWDLRFDTVGRLAEVYVNPWVEDVSVYDSAAMHQVLQDYLAFNTARYGNPSKVSRKGWEPYGYVLDDFGYYFYTWEICDGLYIHVEPSTIIYEGEIIRRLSVTYSYRPITVNL